MTPRRSTSTSSGPLGVGVIDATSPETATHTGARRIPSRSPHDSSQRIDPRTLCALATGVANSLSEPTSNGRQPTVSRNKEESRQALRTALLAWGIIAILLGIGLIVLDYFVKNEYFSLGLMSLSSASLSIAGALLITEWIIKPLYVRDVLHVANLSSEIHNLGLRHIKTSHKVGWAEIFAGASDITAAAGNENAFRSGPWVAIMDAARAATREVRVHISMRLANDGFGATIERQWRDNGCGARGSKLFVIPHDTVTQGLVVRCDSWIAATIADDPLNDDPPILVFAPNSSETIVSALQRGVDRLNNASTPPIAGA